MALHTQPPRTTSARRTLAGLLLIPLVSLTGLWAFTASITLGNVIQDQHYNTFVNTIAPTVVGLEQTLEPERTLTLLWLSADRRSPQLRSQLLAARRGTDATAVTVRAATASVRGLLSATGQAQLGRFLSELDGLARLRSAVDAGTYSPVTAFTAYSAVSSAEYGFLHNAAPPGDPTVSLMTQASIAEIRAEDYTAGAIALVEAALAARGQMTQPERVLFSQVVAEQNLEIDDAFALADPDLAALFRDIFGAPAYRQLLTTENQITSGLAGRAIIVRPGAYRTTARALQAATSRFSQPRIGEVLAAESGRLSDRLLTELYLAGGLGLAAVAASVFAAVRFGRRFRRELTGLYDSARQMADGRLPRLVERLRRGEDVDVAAESPPLRPGRVTEIANVALAFSTVQRTAVEAAVGQASLRKGVNQVFVSLSLRNQSLLHRQLAMLDEMERATSDPVALADLFRLDHLTTRMRRHAEGLLILAGATPGRGWRDPVPVADVLNAAVAEVEDYVRVDVATESSDAVAGTAVNDVIHLLAELIENAAAFSPPSTRVEVRGAAVGHGFAVEIEDRGLGMPAAEIAAINERLARPPEFDLADTDQLGLFVAAQLARRHQIGISLRPSPFGGTTAIVLLPPDLIVSVQDADPAAGARSGSGLPLAPPNGLARGRGRAGDGGPAPAFGLTGRHRQPGPPALASAAIAPGTPQASLWFSPVRAPGENAAAGAGSGDARFADTAFTAGAGADFSAASEGSRPGLPRRTRQASLAPQLRRTSGPAPESPGREPALAPPETAADGPLRRSPEEASSMLSALQAGWQRARTENGGHSYGEEE